MKNITTYESFNNEFDDSNNWNLDNWYEHRKKIKEDPEYKNRWKEHQSSKVKEYWMTLKPFEKESDVPEIPNPLNEFYVKKLIELGAIPKSKLEDGEWYYGNYRNSNFGKWNEDKQRFDIIRYKFGNRWDDCNHFEDDNGYALFIPIRKVKIEEMQQIEKEIDSINQI